VYVGKNDIPRPLGGMGLSIISTSQGILSDKDARTRGIGGEVLCEVW
jgi:small subunit ribosomal protein S8